MKRLFLLRHGHCVKNPGEDDFKRTLSADGLLEAKKVGKFLLKENLIPEMVISSPALRTVETHQAVFGLNFDFSNKPEVVLDKRIYNASCDDIIEVIRETAQSVNNLMIVGHNPSITSIISEFKVEVKENKDYVRAINTEPTCKLVVLEFKDIKWADVRNAGSYLRAVYWP